MCMNSIYELVALGMTTSKCLPLLLPRLLSLHLHRLPLFIVVFTCSWQRLLARGDDPRPMAPRLVPLLFLLLFSLITCFFSFFWFVCTTVFPRHSFFFFCQILAFFLIWLVSAPVHFSGLPSSEEFEAIKLNSEYRCVGSIRNSIQLEKYVC